MGKLLKSYCILISGLIKACSLLHLSQLLQHILFAVVPVCVKDNHNFCELVWNGSRNFGLQLSLGPSHACSISSQVIVYRSYRLSLVAFAYSLVLTVLLVARSAVLRGIDTGASGYNSQQSCLDIYVGVNLACSSAEL